MMHALSFRRRLAFASIALSLALSCAAGINAATLLDYQHRVAMAATLLEELHGAGEDERSTQPEQFISTNLARAREFLPAQEEISFAGQTLPVNNAWFHESLAEIEKTSSVSARADLLARAAERLHAIDERLQEIQNARPGTRADKDADKGRLAEILRRPEYLRTAPEESALERLLQRFLRWLSGLMPKTKPIQPGSSRTVSAIAQILVVAVCVITVAFLIWRFAPRLLKGRRKKKPKREARIVLGERLEPDQTAADLLAHTEALAKQGDLRAAIRKAYIALLCELGDRKIISLAQAKTSHDYLNAVRDKASLYASMRKLTNTF